MIDSLVTAARGFALGASLIVAIGAQNAFVLRQGLTRRHVFPVVAFCALSDAALITAGSAGFGSLVASSPILLTIVGFGGAIFLGIYGAHAFLRAWRPGSLSPLDAPAQPLLAVMTTIAALTFLNPHVYLDTVMLLGGIAGGYPPGERVRFAAGAMTASIVWFTLLGYGARRLTPIFARPAAWRVLDVVIGVVMWAIASGLLIDVGTRIL